ncbi:MAG TPA: HutD family protein [Candidatus Baltobacteraceae bacterium]|jgi:hypothetical protein
MDVLRAASYQRVAWKNGGGVTDIVEAFRGEPSAWRISIARIDRDGPFSDFSGYDRTIVPLSGGAITLVFAAGEERRLTPLAPFSFPGEAAVDARLAGEPASDLNVITLRATHRHEVAVIGIGENGVPIEAGDACGLLYVVEGIAGIAGETAGAGDAIRLDADMRAIVEARGGPVTAILVRICAVPKPR